MITCMEKLLLKVYDAQRKASKEAISTDKDIVTACDVAIAKTIKQNVMDWKFPMEIITEEFGESEKNCVDPVYSVYVDELDGTDNAFRGIDVLPSVSLIQIAKKPKGLVRFKDFELVGAVEHLTGTAYIIVKNGGVQKYKIKILGNGYKLEKVELRVRHPKQSVIITDVYSMKNETEILSEIAGLYQTKDFGASAATYLWVAEGMFEGYASSHKKGHELPLLYLMCKENNVKMTDFSGNSYDDVVYDFNSTRYQVIAGIEDVHFTLKSVLKKFAREM